MNELKITTISDKDITVKEYNGNRVITFKDIDEVHHRPEGTAKRNFRVNRKRFIEGEDFYTLSERDEIRSLGFSRPQGGLPDSLTLVTESGYLMLVKSFTDDLAWDVQRQLVNCYFHEKRIGASAATRPLTTDDYVDAARTVAKCQSDKLPIVLGMYQKAGLDITAIREMVQNLGPTEYTPAELVERLNHYSLGELMKLLKLPKSSLYYYKTGKCTPHKERIKIIIETLRKNEAVSVI